jgi:hypothetical protein
MKGDEMRTVLLAGVCVALAAGMAPAPAAAQLGDSVLVWIRVPPSVRAGQAVPIRLSLTNRLARPVRLRIAGTRAPVWSLRVTDARGAIVWNHHDAGTGFVGGTLTLGPHETRTRTIVWDQRDVEGRPVPRGEYHVRGLLYANLPRNRFADVVPLRIR